jgi:hypothetical protein
MAAAILALFCSKTFNNVIMIRPEQPNGCPSEPFTFTLSLSNPNILEFESYYSKCLIKSKYSTSLKAIPALSSARKSL